MTASSSPVSSSPVPSSSAPPLPGAPFLAWQQGRLHLDGVCLRTLAQQHQTPLFVYSANAMQAALDAYRRAFVGRSVHVHYAVKANSSLAILQWFARQGCGFDIVSGGELERVLRAGAVGSSVVFSGVGKSRTEMRRALEAGVACFNVESVAELEVLNRVAEEMGCTAPVSLRVNPDVDPQTHPYISTGLKANKFGIAHDRAEQAYMRAAALPHVRVEGIACHIGSQITQITPYLDALERILDMVERLEAGGVPIQHIDLGGGLGIQYRDEQPPAADALWAQIFSRLDARGFGSRHIMLEPGRSLVGNAGVCLTEVLYTKPGEEKNYCVVDAAMNDLPRPALYQAYHAIVPVCQPAADAPEGNRRYDVVGPVCESGDWLGRDRRLSVQSGDILAVLSAGAYCMSMASQYNTRGRAAEVLIAEGNTRLIRTRDSFDDMVAQEQLLPEPSSGNS